MNEINPQEQLNAYQLICQFSWHVTGVDSFRRFNRLHTKFCRTHYTAEELEKLREGLTGNEVKPKSQLNHYQLCAMYGAVHYPEKGKAIKFANQWNDIDAFAHIQSFYNQEESFYDLDKKFIW